MQIIRGGALCAAAPHWGCVPRVFKAERCSTCGGVYTTFACGECNTTTTERAAASRALAAYRKARRESEE